MTEQLALQQGLGQRTAADLDKGPFPAVRVLVNIMGQHGLAGAGFTGDQHRRHGVGDGVHQPQELVHLPVAEHQVSHPGSRA